MSEQEARRHPGPPEPEPWAVSCRPCCLQGMTSPVPVCPPGTADALTSMKTIRKLDGSDANRRFRLGIIITDHPYPKIPFLASATPLPLTSGHLFLASVPCFSFPSCLLRGGPHLYSSILQLHSAFTSKQVTLKSTLQARPLFSHLLGVYHPNHWPHIAVLQNLLEHLLKHRLLGFTPRFLIHSVSLGWGQSISFYSIKQGNF